MTTQSRWMVETSFLFQHPEFVEAENTTELQQKLQELANDYEGQPIGKLRFTYELRDEKPILCRSSFINNKGGAQRFMRLNLVEVEQ